MYKHSETIDVLKEYIGQQIKVYVSEKNPYESYVGTLLEVKIGGILVRCNVKASTEEKIFLFFEKSEYITKIVCAETWEKTLYEVIRISPEALADIRNTLGPVKNLLALLQSNQKNNPVTQEMIKQEIQNAKAAVEYLSNLKTI